MAGISSVVSSVPDVTPGVVMRRPLPRGAPE